MLVRSFNLIDIKKYEYSTGNNILSFFNNFSIAGILDLISLGNGNCSADTAAELLDNYLSSGNNTILDAILEIKNKLIGVGDNEGSKEGDDKIDISKYESLTDLYINFSMQLMSVGLSYQDFWSMNTNELFKVFNSIYIKMQNETNRDYNNSWVLASLISAGVWGHLPKEAPRVDMSSREQHKDENLDLEDVITVANLKSFVNRHNKNETEKGE